MQSSLPVASKADDLLAAFSRANRVVLTAPPGAGKSTWLPVMLYERLLKAQGGRLLLLEPRRIAARAVAERMAELLGEEIGQTVGYRVRRDHCVGPDTRIEVITEGILTRMLIDDPTLDGVAMVVLDEFHERNLHTDTALALICHVQQLLRADLRLLVMSATLDADALSRHLQAELIQSDGRMYPVTVRHLSGDAVHAVHVALREEEGDILVFLPGEREIVRTAEALSNITTATIHPLYGRLGKAEQWSAIRPSADGRRRVVLATNIAETSLTIEGIRVVIDSGQMRTAVYDGRTGLSRLQTVSISQDMATQRAGRAGRLTEGVCYRLYSPAEYARMAEHRQPEIAVADLSGMLLALAAFGAQPAELDWLTAPPKAALSDARRLLQCLGALDDEGRITPTGRKMDRLPCQPRLAKMQLTARENGTDPALAARIADVLEEGRGTLPATCAAGRLLASAFPERIAQALGNGRFRTADGHDVRVDAASVLAAERWLAVADMNAESGRVFVAAPLSEEDVHAYATVRDVLRFDTRQGGVVAQQELRVGGLLLEARPLKNPDRDSIVAVVAEAAQREGRTMLDMAADEVACQQQRIAAVAQWHPELGLPDVSTEALLASAPDWLPMYLVDGNRVLQTTAELRRLPMAKIVWQRLDYPQQQAVDRLAPTHITVPTGSRIRVDYRTGAERPVVSVRLQECFGLTDTPRVDDGCRAVLMELLSPGYKPVQLTSDLRSFWQTTYFEVRKELRRRYPKHAWPEDPLTAEAERRPRFTGRTR